MQKLIPVLGAACALFLLLGVAHADESKSPSLSEIRAQQLQIRSEVLAGSGAYKDMSKSQRDELIGKQSELLALLGERESLDELNEGDKIKAFNSLEWIKATITRAEDERIVCERSRPVGSNRVQRICATVAERRANREAADRALSDRPLCGGTCEIPSR